MHTIIYLFLSHTQTNILLQNFDENLFSSFKKTQKIILYNNNNFTREEGGREGERAYISWGVSMTSSCLLSLVTTERETCVLSGVVLPSL